MPKYSKQNSGGQNIEKNVSIFTLCNFSDCRTNAQEKAVVEVNGIYGGGSEGSLNDAALS